MLLMHYQFPVRILVRVHAYCLILYISYVAHLLEH
jgi:hypothetical protein